MQCAIVGGSRTMALIHVKRGGNGPIWNISTCPLAACAARFLALLLDLPEPVGGTPSTAICSGLPVPRGRAHPLSHGHQITRDDLRRIGPGGGRGYRCAVAFVSKGDSDARAGFGDFDDLGGFGNVVGSRPNV